MKTRMMLVSLALIVSGCGGGGGSASNPPVDPAAVASITVSPADVTLLAGESMQLNATLRNARGEVLQGRSISWQSADTSTASVSTAGLIQAVRAGNVVINASADGKLATARVAVNAPPAVVNRIVLDNFNARLQEGSSLQLRATALDAGGTPIAGRGEIWSAPADGILTVSPTGSVTGLRPGVASVTVRIDGAQTSATLTIFAEHSHDLILGGALVGVHAETYQLDLRDPAAAAQPLFVAGRHASHASPSPLGDRIAFVVHNVEASNWQSWIYVVNRDGSGLVRITQPAARNDSPVWSTDGTRIAFSSQPFGERADVWVMNADGTAALNLTSDLADSSQYSPAWSPAMPGGERIAFTRRQGGIGNLWSMRPDGSDKRAVTVSAEFDDDEAAWSPDGQRLVFRRSGTAVFSDLYVVASTGGSGQALMPFQALAFDQLSPAWSPDGNLIAFASRHGDGESYQLWTVWPDGTRLAQRTFDPQFHSNPAWIRRVQ